MFIGFGRPRRNQPVDVPSVRPDNRPMRSDTGDAGRDGYTVVSRADRETGIRRPAGTPCYEGPRQED